MLWDIIHWLLKVDKTYEVDINSGEKKILFICLPSTLIDSDIDQVKAVAEYIVNRLNIDTSRLELVFTLGRIEMMSWEEVTKLIKKD